MPLIRLFFDICLFNKGPQDCPASMLLLGLAVAANLAVGTGLSLVETGWIEALTQSVMGILMLAGFFGGALYFTRKLPRFLQTATAAFGCDTLISSLAVPLLIWGQLTPDVKGVAGVLLLLMMFWQITVIGHILRHALSIPFIAGLGLALAYTAASIGIMMALYPPVD
jgi:hypothetical protein